MLFLRHVYKNINLYSLHNKVKNWQDTTILINVWSLHHDLDHWGDPEVFRPERFINKEGVLKSDDWVMPFGLGKKKFNISTCQMNWILSIKRIILLPENCFENWKIFQAGVDVWAKHWLKATCSCFSVPFCKGSPFQPLQWRIFRHRFPESLALAPNTNWNWNLEVAECARQIKFF